MGVESERSAIEIEVSAEMIEELAARASTMGLTASEYAMCVIGQRLVADSAPEG